MPVAFNAKGTAPLSSSTSTVDFNNLTVTAGANALVATVYLGSTSDLSGSMTVTWDFGGTNQALTLISSYYQSGLRQGIQMWGLVSSNLTIGNKTLRFTGLGANSSIVNAISTTGANPTGGAATFKNVVQSTGSGGNASAVVTSATNDFVIGFFFASTQLISTVDHTSFYISGITGANYSAGASTVTLGAMLSGSDTWFAIGVDVAAIAGIAIGAQFGGAGALSVNAQKSVNSSAATLVGAGALSTDTIQNQRASVVFGGLGSLSASLSSTPFIAATLSGAGALSSLSSLTSQVAARFADTGALSVFGAIPGQIAQGVGYIQGAGKLSAFAGIQQSIAARLSGAGALSTLVGKQTSLAAILAGTGGFSGASKFDFFPVVTHSNPVPIGSSNYDPTLTPEDNNARLMMITSNLNDEHAINMPSGAILGRTDSGFGPVQGIRLSAPLLLTADGTVVVDIATLKTLLGLPP